MNDILNQLFSTDAGKKIYSDITSAINDYGMKKHLEVGTLLGLSGGADSVMLLLALLELRRNGGHFPLVCVHVNHLIRGDEADRDERFCEELCQKLGVALLSYKIDVPTVAKEKGCGLEEAARAVRYSVFSDIVNERPEVGCIAVAHNATDNLETIIFNIMRGAGISGVAGIKPVRDNIIRPLIYSSKKDIAAALDTAGIPYVTDSTNLSSDYTRNYIRNEILPKLERLNPTPEKMGTRVSKNLLDDAALLDSLAIDFISSNVSDGRLPTNKLKELPKSQFSRIIREIARQKTHTLPERVHTDSLYDLISGGDFSYSLPGGVRLVSKDGYAFITDEARTRASDACSLDMPLHAGVNVIPGYSSVIIISDVDCSENYSNIYKIAIQAALPFDIIDIGLAVRTKKDGDAYSYGGITRKLKKLFNDRKIPPSERDNVPVIYDENGIVWVPGFGVRSEENKLRKSYIAIAEPISGTEKDVKKFFVIQRDGAKT